MNKASENQKNAYEKFGSELVEYCGNIHKKHQELVEQSNQLQDDDIDPNFECLLSNILSAVR